MADRIIHERVVIETTREEPAQPENPWTEERQKWERYTDSSCIAQAKAKLCSLREAEWDRKHR